VPEAEAQQAFLRIFDPRASRQDLANLALTKIGPVPGDLTSPDLDLTAVPGIGTVGTETFIIPGNSEYDVTYDSSQNVSSVRVNNNTGGS
jgi:hypothetical protein